MLKICTEQGLLTDKAPGCGRVYDDEYRSTICPHSPLGYGSAYCEVHDLVHCPHCSPVMQQALADEPVAKDSSATD